MAETPEYQFESDLPSALLKAINQPVTYAVPIVPCAPNCQKTHMHNFEFNYAKNSSSPMKQRPGQ